MRNAREANVSVVILKKPDLVLLVKEEAEWKKFPRRKFFKPSKWGLPNGGKEPGESEVEAAIRETKEETGFLIEVDPKIRIIEYKEDYVSLTFLGHIVGGKMRTRSKEIVACNWFSLSSLPQDMYSSHRRRLSQLLKELVHS